MDRRGGGAAELRLFTVEETTGVRWPALQLELDLDRVDDERRRAAVVLLGVTIALLLEGQLGDDWWAWLRDVAAGAELPELLEGNNG